MQQNRDSAWGTGGYFSWAVGSAAAFAGPFCAVPNSEKSTKTSPCPVGFSCPFLPRVLEREQITGAESMAPGEKKIHRKPGAHGDAHREVAEAAASARLMGGSALGVSDIWFGEGHVL